MLIVPCMFLYRSWRFSPSPKILLTAKRNCNPFRKNKKKVLALMLYFVLSGRVFLFLKVQRIVWKVEMLYVLQCRPLKKHNMHTGWYSSDMLTGRWVMLNRPYVWEPRGIAIPFVAGSSFALLLAEMGLPPPVTLKWMIGYRKWVAALMFITWVRESLITHLLPFPFELPIAITFLYPISCHSHLNPPLLP